MNLKIYFALAFLFSLVSCETPYGYKYNEGNLPDSPVNLEPFNSEYDDFNSTAPAMGRIIPFCFSTNRNSKGGTFDVIYEPMNITFDKSSGELTVKNDYNGWYIYISEYAVIKNGLDKINTSRNEYGPYIIYDRSEQFTDADLILMYASDMSGDFDIHYLTSNEKAGFSESKPVKFLNSGFNDIYPTFNSDYSKIYFCSNRENGHYSIYSVDITVNNREILRPLSDTNMKAITKVNPFAGNYDDRCPYIFENKMVFASDRPGGFGGFDLYYSIFENGVWSTPVNFGSRINTAADEYRPILFDEEIDFKKDMMVFSSNRPGGKGGMDLYFVGVKKD